MFTRANTINDQRLDLVALYERLVKECPEFDDLFSYRPEVAFLLRDGAWRLNGRTVLGACHIPGVQGNLSQLFDWLLEKEFGFAPQFLIVMEREFWEAATPRQREILMFHEMSHIAIARDGFGEKRFNKISGDPVWAIAPHDIEEFDAVARRYGAHSPDVARFVEAVKQGESK